MEAPEVREIENPFHAHASEGYAWALIESLGDSSPLTISLTGALLRTKTWMSHTDLLKSLDTYSHSLALAKNNINKRHDNLIGSRTIADVDHWRLNPEAFAQRRKEVLGKGLDPAIIRTILLTRQRLTEAKTPMPDPVLNKIDKIFSEIKRQTGRLCPSSQQAILLLIALGGEHGYRPHNSTGIKAMNNDGAHRLSNKLSHEKFPLKDSGEFLARHPSPKSKEHWYVATPALIEFLGGQDAIDQLKARVLDDDGNFPLPIHAMTVDQLRTIGTKFIEHSDDTPPPPPPPEAIETYNLSPTQTYTITKESERAAGGGTLQYNAFHGDPLQVLTPESDFSPYLEIIATLLDISGQTKVVEEILKETNGGQKIMTFLSGKCGIKNPQEEVIIGYNRGNRGRGLTVVKAAVLVPYRD